MIVDRTLVILGLVVGVALVLLGLSFRHNKKPEVQAAKKDKVPLGKKLSSEYIIGEMNDSPFVEQFGSFFSGQKELEILFRKAKNPWNLNPYTFNFIRYGGLIAGLILALLVSVFFDWLYALIPLAFGILCFVLPKKKYEDIAHKREVQWLQTYQFMWVIKHNLSYFDPKKTWYEVEKYIKSHTENLPELEQGFHDFGAHWNPNGMDEYIKTTYGDFVIAKQLYEIVAVSQQTGEYPENELNSLRTVILEKMNYHCQEVLQMVGTKATIASAPFLLVSVSLVILVPVCMQIISVFSG